MCQYGVNNIKKCVINRITKTFLNACVKEGARTDEDIENIFDQMPRIGKMNLAGVRAAITKTENEQRKYREKVQPIYNEFFADMAKLSTKRR